MRKLSLFIAFLFTSVITYSQDQITTGGIPGDVNSSSQDVRPVIADDGKTLYINRRFHPGNIKGDKDFQDVWVSKYDQRGVWTKPTNMGETYNDKKANDLVRASNNSDSLIFVNTGYKGIRSELALFIKGKNDALEMPIDGFYNKSPYVDFDYNFTQKVILMAVERKDTEGDQDLYYSVYDYESQSYSTPMTMGKVLNTDKADFAPFLTKDSRTLFFVSYGHKGYGGADIYMSHRKGDDWDDWTEPENLGNIINTKFDETFVSVDPSFDYLYYDSYPQGATNRNVWRATLSQEIKDKIIAAKNKAGQQEINVVKQPVFASSSNQDVETKADSTPQPIKQEILAEPIAANTMTAGETNQQTTEENNQIAALAIEKEQEIDSQNNNSQGFLSKIGEKLGIGGGSNDPIKLIDEGARGYKINRNLYFKFDSDKLQNKYNGLLDQISAELEKNPNIKILVEGHTDGIGGEDVNIDMSCRRANIVKDALVAKGINEMRIEISCEGKERPIATNDDETEGRELNRRVEFYLF